MANMAAFTTYAGGAINYADTGKYSSACQFVDGEDDSVQVGGAEYDIDEIATPGVDGVDTKDYGFRGQDIQITVIYVGVEATIASDWDAHVKALGAGPSTLVLNGVTYYGCLLDARATKRGMIKSTGGPSPQARFRATIAVRSTRLE